MSAFQIQEPPRKKQRISPIKDITSNITTNDTNKAKKFEYPEKTEVKESKEKEVEEEEEYFYSLHLNKNMILFSTNPNVPCNTNFDIEPHENAKPNLFIVKKAENSYNSMEWLDYHLNKTNDIKDAAKLLNKRNLSLLIVTGAGMGCDSNLPDYRSPGGFWNDYKPFKSNKKLSLYEMSKTDWFNNDPLSAWGFYAHRAKLYRTATPHSGFNVLYNLTSKKRDYMYMTSNIDGQAIKAGFKDNKIYQTHGSLHHLQCMNICADSIIEPFYDGFEKLKVCQETLRMVNLNNIPKCSFCKGLTRPNVSFFTDTSNTYDDERTIEQKNKFMKWLNPFKKGKKELLVIEIGCGKSIHSLRWECEYLKSLSNVTLIRINPTDDINITDNKSESDKKLKDRHITLKLPAKLALDSIQKYLNQ